MTKALMVIDAQVNMLTGEWALPDSEKIIRVLAERIQRARQDGTPIIQVLNEVEEGWPVELFDPYFKPNTEDFVIWKATPSVFESNPEFAAKLQALGYRELELIGMQSDLCLSASAIDAAKLGFKVSAPAGLHFTYPSETQAASEISQEWQERMAEHGVQG